jgi:hemoglobin
MKFLLATALALALATPLVHAQAQAQAQHAGPSTVIPGTAPIPADDKLYQALGGRDNIQRFTNDFYDTMLQDARIARFFDGINVKYLKGALADYFCVVAGGPCVYEGVGMKDAHAHLGIAKGDFNTLVEHLQRAMDKAQVPFSAQNRLLARLAFSHREVVTK